MNPSNGNSKTSGILVVGLMVAAVFSGCLAGDFETVVAPTWESGYSWDWKVDTESTYESEEASGSSKDSESTKLLVAGTADLKDGDSAYIVAHEQGMGQFYGRSKTELVSQDDLQPIARTWDDLDCGDDIRWREPSHSSGGVLPPLEFPLNSGDTWSMKWDSLSWEAEVLGMEDIETEAGEFAAVEVRLEAEQSTGHPEPTASGPPYGPPALEDFEFTMSVWYAEEARQIVKAVGENSWSSTVAGEKVERVRSVDMELTSFSLQHEEGTHLEDVDVGPIRPPMLPPLEITSDREMPLNSAQDDTTVTFSLQERTYDSMPYEESYEDEPSPSTSSSPPVAPDYEYPEDWDEDELYWVLQGTDPTRRSEGERLEEARGAEFTVDFPTYGRFEVLVSDEPISTQPIEHVMVSYSPVEGGYCSGEMPKRVFSRSEYVSVHFEDTYTVEQEAGLPEEIPVASFDAPDLPGRMYVTVSKDNTVFLIGDDGQLEARAPNGDEIVVESGAPGITIDQQGEWDLVWDSEGFEGIVATGHSAEITVELYPQ